MKQIRAADLCYGLHSTAFGAIAIMWSVYQGRPRISRVLLAKSGDVAGQLVKTAYPDAASASVAEIDAVAEQMAAFLTGENMRFSLDLVRLDLCTEFQRRVLYTEYGIPRGRVSTYARIAAHLGQAQAARAVGAALAHNPFPLIIPCHRAIRTDGTLGGYQGGLAMKRRLLEMEGVTFDGRGRVAPEETFFFAHVPEAHGPVTAKGWPQVCRHGRELDR
jgi:methylated-DNA-[protein]-cysteine S-methyltransferase